MKLPQFMFPLQWLCPSAHLCSRIFLLRKMSDDLRLQSPGEKGSCLPLLCFAPRAGWGGARRRQACPLCARNTHIFLPLVLTKLLQTLAYCPHFINKESGASFIQGHTTSEWRNWGLNPDLFSIVVCTLPTPEPICEVFLRWYQWVVSTRKG